MFHAAALVGRGPGGRSNRKEDRIMKETLLGFVICVCYFGVLGLLACYAPILFLVVGGIMFVFGLAGGAFGGGSSRPSKGWFDDDGGQ